MVDDQNELEWRRHMLSAIDNVSKKIDENSAEHIVIRAEVAAVKLDVTALKSADPDKKFTDYINSSRSWRLVIVGQLIAMLAIVGTAIWNFSALTHEVRSLHANQIENLRDVDDLKMTSAGYREWRMKSGVVASKNKVTP